MTETSRNPSIGTSGCIARDRYLARYEAIERDFRDQIASFGLPFAPRRDQAERERLFAQLLQCGAVLSNDEKSIHAGWLSPSCVQCRKGIGAATFLLSVQCPRNCYFCFNPNQIDYDRLLHETNDVVAELDAMRDRGIDLTDIALTGGEPLVHPEESLAFLEHAKRVFPNARTRLYTSGAFLDDGLLARLKEARLDEMRFSIKLDEPPRARAELLELIVRSKRFVDSVVVEMPVMPDDLEDMKALLVDLDVAGIDGINLLELCYPLHNAEAFAARGYAVKNPPYRVLYDYWYAGGLPIDGSEEACLRLIMFAQDAELELGVHYCSLENKLTSQIYLQNSPYRNSFAQCVLSERDWFLKTVRAFGDDAKRVAQALDARGVDGYELDEEDGSVAFSPNLVPLFGAEFADMPIGISSNVVERADGAVRLRELDLRPTTLHSFDRAAI